MKAARVTRNFIDAQATAEHWHVAGQRYLSVHCFLATGETDPIPALERLARTLSPDDRFAVELSEHGERQEVKSISVYGHVFKHVAADDHIFHLGSLEETEVDEIIALLNSTETVVGYGATELISIERRGGAVKRRPFMKRKEA